MKFFFATATLVAMTTFAPAAETKPYVSATFQDILSRVSLREKQSKAILFVNSKPDAAGFGGLKFEISQRKEGGGAVYVSLFMDLKPDRVVFESYRLKPDAAMLEELANQKKLAELQNERRK